MYLDLIIGILFSGIFFAVKQACRLWTPKLAHGVHDKFHDMIYKIIMHSWFTCYSISLCLSKDYFWDTTLLWAYEDGRLREHNCTRRITLGERILYITMFGFYLLLMLTQFHDPQRSDFWAYFAHHVITMILVTVGYSSGYASLGIIVALCHGPTDIFLALAKLCIYLGMKFLTDVFFVLFVIFWVFLRLYLYPLKCILSLFPFWRISILSILPLPLLEQYCSSLIVDCSFYLLLALYSLDVYWGLLILKVLRKKLTTGETKDVRSGDEDNLGDGKNQSVQSNIATSRFR